MEALRAELSRAKEQARISNAAALKADEELKAEKAAHCESQEKMAKMAVELKTLPTVARSMKKKIKQRQRTLRRPRRWTKTPVCYESEEGGAAGSRGYCGWETLHVREKVL